MSDLYFCPTNGEIESAQGSGFKGGTCCAHPELHTYLGYSTPGIEALSKWLSDKARAEYARDDQNAREHKEHTQRQTAIALCDHGADRHGPETGCVECICPLTIGHREAP
jgi:hypothetical protein